MANVVTMTAPFTTSLGVGSVQGTVIWRARLCSTTLPQGESHFFLRGSMIATVYPISQDQFVWTVGAPVSCLEELGLAAKCGPTGPKTPAKGNEPSSEGKQGQAQGASSQGNSASPMVGSADSEHPKDDKCVTQHDVQQPSSSLAPSHGKTADLSASEVPLAVSLGCPQLFLAGKLAAPERADKRRPVF